MLSKNVFKKLRKTVTNSAHEVQLSARGGLVQSSLLHGAGFPPVTSSVVALTLLLAAEQELAAQQELAPRAAGGLR